MNKTKLISTALIIWIVSTIYSFLTCGWLFNWIYKIPPNIWHDPETIMSTNNMIGSLALGLLMAIIFVMVYAILYKGIPGSGLRKGVMYGLLIWLIGPFVGISTMPLYMTIALEVIVYWLVSMLVINIINGMVVGLMYKVK